MSKKMRSNILLLITAAIWGSAFVAQKSGMDYIGPLTYGGIRTFIGGLALIPVILFLDKGKSKTEVKKTPEEEVAEKKLLIIGGICCGLALFVASTLSAIRRKLHDGGQGRVYYDTLCCYGSDFFGCTQEKSQTDYLALRFNGSDGALSPLHDGRVI